METDKSGSQNFDYCIETYPALGELDIITFCDNPMMLTLIGSLEEKTCLDLGCGDGRLTRLIKKISSPKRLVGVDISNKMIDFAKSLETQEPLGIDYQLGDIYQLDLAEQFDCVVVSFLLSISHDRNNLAEMLSRIYEHLKPGGTMVVTDDHLFLQPEHFPKLNKYKFSKRSLSPDSGDLKEGDTIQCRLDCAGEWIEVIETYLPKFVWENAIQNVGFVDVDWHRPVVNEEGLVKHGEHFWQDYVELPVTLFITANKPII